MKANKFLMIALGALLFTAVQINAIGQVAKDKFATEMANGSAIRFDMAAANSGGTLTISAPDGRIFSKQISAGANPEFQLVDNQGERLPDGIYIYELRLTPALALASKDSSAARRDEVPEAVRAGRRPAAPGLVQSGSFQILNGQVIVAGSLQETPRLDKTTDKPRGSGAAMSGNTVRRLQNHRFSLGMMFDQVIADDLIVQGSTCGGLDCVNNESFGFDTLRLKENNTRISFNDTSTSAGFPSNDWTIRANSSSSGGGNFLAFVDRGSSEDGSETGTIIFEVDAGAPANSLRVSSAGKVGIKTAAPVLDVHVNSTDTPALRMEQNNSGGFTAQTWDIGANEANWFVRDVTGGSRLPLRIRPGAPTSSIDISATGNVGVGTASPGRLLSVVSGSSDAIVQMSRGANTFLASLELKTTSTQDWLVGTRDTSNSDFHLFSFGTSADALTVLRSNGNVGIATTAPTDTLSVNGSASKPGGGTWSVFSDERLKNISGRFTPGLSAVMQLQPLRYRYRSGNALGLAADKEYVGFGAQAVQKVIPEAVSTTASGYLQINSDPILWTMLNAIKEQQKEIESLKSQVAKLKATSHRRPRR
ncbi:MAG TPA: tail fiber domain-containing protein [Pyrinomonadaceae bacterium]|nr:tail fiber domain-containing protein [Pyrinomonadaceae bacterium]